MTALRTAAQQALESIDWLRHHLIQHHGCLHMDPTASGIPAWLNKNEAALRAALAEPVQEPVAWLFTNLQSGEWDFCYCEDEHDHDREMWHRQPLYTAPPQRKPLPEDEIALIVADCSASAHRHDDFSFARAIERAHGIGGQE